MEIGSKMLPSSNENVSKEGEDNGAGGSSENEAEFSDGDNDSKFRRVYEKSVDKRRKCLSKENEEKALEINEGKIHKVCLKSGLEQFSEREAGKVDEDECHPLAKMDFSGILNALLNLEKHVFSKGVTKEVLIELFRLRNELLKSDVVKSTSLGVIMSDMKSLVEGARNNDEGRVCLKLESVLLRCLINHLVTMDPVTGALQSMSRLDDKEVGLKRIHQGNVVSPNAQKLPSMFVQQSCGGFAPNFHLPEELETQRKNAIQPVRYGASRIYADGGHQVNLPRNVNVAKHEVSVMDD